MRLVLALDPALEDRYLGEILREGHEVLARPAGATDLAAALSSLRPDAAVVGAGARTLGTGVLAAADDAGVRLVALAAADEERRHATGLGLHEVLDADAPWALVAAVLGGGAAVAPPEPARPAGAGTVLAVWGPAGAPGRTTTAIALATEAASRAARVLLVDADTYGASIAPSLGLLDEAPGFAAACRLAGAQGLDEAQLDRVAEQYRFGAAMFRVLTGISRTSRWPELSADRVRETLRVCREHADVVIVDVGFNLEADEELVTDLFAPRRNAATLTALAEADVVVAVGAADPVGLARFLRGHAELLQLVPAERVHAVVTRVRSSAVGASPASQIASALLRFGGIQQATLVPSDPAAFDAALLTARTLQEAAPRSPALAALRELGADVLPLPAVPTRSVPRRRFLRPAPA